MNSGKYQYYKDCLMLKQQADVANSKQL